MVNTAKLPLIINDTPAILLLRYTQVKHLLKGKENIKFPNTIKGNWHTTKPLEIVVSDMTCIKHKGVRWEWTYLLDVFNNEIIASSVTDKIGSSLPYYHCLEELINKKKEQNYPVTLHTDQGSVYSSAGFIKPIKIILTLSVLCQEPKLRQTI